MQSSDYATNQSCLPFHFQTIPSFFLNYLKSKKFDHNTLTNFPFCLSK